MPTTPVAVLAVAAIVALVAASALFSSSETAIFTLPDAPLAERSPGDDRRVAVLHELRSDPHRLLVTILVGNNVVNVAISSITTALLIDRLSTGVAVALATVLASSVVLVFGEIVPKAYGLGHAERWALAVATPISLAERGLYPLVLVFDLLTRRLNELIGGKSDIEKPYVGE